MSRRMLAGIVAGVLVLAGAVGYLISDRTNSDDNEAIASFDECVAAGHPVSESYPRKCSVPSDGTFTEVLEHQAFEFTSPKGVLIKLNDLPSGASVSSPVTITGEVPGSWSFEATFPVVLVDWDGRIIAEGPAHLTGDWMTEELVAFTVTLEFEKPTVKNNGALILRTDNPSGLPANDDAIEIPVVFE
jgi:hypothetical protein